MSYHQGAEHRFGHPILAAFCAGPAFLVILALATIVTSPAAATGAAWVIVAIPFALAIGFFVAIVPNLLCTFVLRELAAHHMWLRAPVIWGMVGVVLAGVVTMALSDTPEVTALFAATGGVSALICRSGVDWT